MLNKSDVGVLKRDTRVKVGDRYGLVFNAHEPAWIDQKTRVFRKELHGADIAFDDESGFRYVQASEITIVL
jgi:hypothetical protein